MEIFPILSVWKPILFHKITYKYSSAVIKEESIDSRAEVKSFDHGKLKHVETQEKNQLPTPQTLREELRPDTLPDVSQVKDFEKTKLKHVEPVEKNPLPSKEGNKFLQLSNYKSFRVISNSAKSRTSAFLSFSGFQA